jgi:Malate/L-lactate dehydrogenase
MQQIHVPLGGVRYWAALSIASVFGANSGDFVAAYLHLGHVRGLLPLAAILAVILVAERRDSAVHQAHYWLAIVVIRTAATNLADFGSFDLALKRVWLIATLAVILTVTLFFSPPSKSKESADPIILDFATSMVAEGKVMVAANGGAKLPPGALIDQDGRLSSDPRTLYGSAGVDLRVDGPWAHGDPWHPQCD